jgi:DNA mismatch endonuclease (patch repair protein)
MSPEKRSALMGRIKGKNTKPEQVVSKALRRAGYYPKRHVRDLPGSPDFVFTKARIAVFIDGDFWHGWRFPLWKSKLTPFWREKISANRERDQRNFRKLRRSGWTVIRIWEHQLKNAPEECILRITEQVDTWRKNRGMESTTLDD